VIQELNIATTLIYLLQGMPIWAENIRQLLTERDLTVSHILLTHWHGDHTGGVPDLIAYNPDFASRVYKNHPDHGQQPIEDGQVFQTEGAAIRAVFTPGHAEDHMCFLLEEENALFTGDNVLGHGFSVVQDLGTYMRSLEYMADQKCAVGYPAHGAKIEDLPRKINEYIRHREFRVKQVYSTLEGNKAKWLRAGQRGNAGLTIREIVRSLHGDVPQEVVQMGLEPFLTEVLWKLAEDRKIGFELCGGTRRWFVNQRTWALEST
jgi:hydrolase